MVRKNLHDTHLLKLPIRLIHAVLGQDNFDDAGDTVVEILNKVCTTTNHSIQYSFDASHPNPWYHTMNLNIGGIPDRDFALLRQEILKIGLLEK